MAILFSISDILYGQDSDFLTNQVPGMYLVMIF